MFRQICGCLVIPPSGYSHAYALGGEGEHRAGVIANMQAVGTLRLTSTARFFGSVEAGNLIVESGAVFVGAASIGQPTGGSVEPYRRG